MKKVNEDVSIEETTNVTTPKKPVKKETKKATVNCPRLNMRKAADVNSDVVVILNENEEVIVKGEHNNFYEVSASGKSGYCMKEFLTIM